MERRGFVEMVNSERCLETSSRVEDALEFSGIELVVLEISMATER